MNEKYEYKENDLKKVITYGTFDLLHYGHINLLKRAKALGDYLIVGVTTDSFDISRGKLNVQQSLMERIQAVKDTGLADEVIPEEYIGQKIDDIRRYHIDVFAIGSDWEGKFDYLKEYCEVVIFRALLIFPVQSFVRKIVVYVLVLLAMSRWLKNLFRNPGM